MNNSEIVGLVLNQTAEYFGVATTDHILSNNKRKYLIMARYTAVFVLNKLFFMSQADICKETGLKQYTVSKGIKSMSNIDGSNIHVSKAYKTVKFFENYIKETKEMSLEPQKLAKATATNKSLEIDRLNKYTARLKTQIGKQKEIITDLNLQLGAYDDENVGLRNELADREGDVEEAVSELSNIQAKLYTTEKRLIDGQKKLKLAYIDNNSLREQLAWYKKSYETAQINYLNLQKQGIVKFTISKVAGKIRKHA